MYFVIYLFIIIQAGLLVANNFSETIRQSKFFGIGYPVGVVRFENKLCTSSERLVGTCYTRRQCREINGTKTTLCASTFGFCCIVQRSCGAITSHNNTYFVNPTFPSTYTGSGSCTLVIKKCNSDICQVRIDFLNFVLAPPTLTGCTIDSLTITGGASLITPICGENSGQHIYVGFNGDNDIKLTIRTSSSYNLHRIWYMKIAQIGCDCPTKAPDGCLMYYTDLTNCVRSFNFGATISGQTYNVMVGMNVIPLAGSREIPNLNYGVCIAMEPGYCSIEWTKCSANSFSTSGNALMPAEVVENCNMGDYIIINNPDIVSTPFDRFCGHTFPDKVISFSKPFILRVVTDDTELLNTNAIAGNDVANLGFCLCYNQVQCMRNIF